MRVKLARLIGDKIRTAEKAAVNIVQTGFRVGQYIGITAPYIMNMNRELHLRLLLFLLRYRRQTIRHRTNAVMVLSSMLGSSWCMYTTEKPSLGSMEVYVPAMPVQPNSPTLVGE